MLPAFGSLSYLIYIGRINKVERLAAPLGSMLALSLNPLHP